jgi:hypothetical protein
MGNDYFWPARDVSMLKEKHVFLVEEGIQQEGFNNLWKKECLVEIMLSPHPYVLRDLMLMRKLTIRWMVLLKTSPMDIGVIFLMMAL